MTSQERLAALLTRESTVMPWLRGEMQRRFTEAYADLEQPPRLTLEELEELAEMADLLLAARDLVRDEDKWTRGSFARNKLGFKVPPWREDACQWCAAGALYKQVPEGERYKQPLDGAFIALYNASRVLFAATPMQVNDSPGPLAWDNVQTIFNRAISGLEIELLTEAYRLKKREYGDDFGE